jgi:hypothetical protein
MAKMLAIRKTEWKSFFDRMSSALLGKRAEIEVASLDLGDQIVAGWVPLLGISYDPNGNLIDVALDRGSHLIRNPQEVLVEEAATGLASVAIENAEGATHVVRLKEPLMLPPATVRR